MRKRGKKEKDDKEEEEDDDGREQREQREQRAKKKRLGERERGREGEVVSHHKPWWHMSDRGP